jgi:hypothetical protein
MDGFFVANLPNHKENSSQSDRTLNLSAPNAVCAALQIRPT